MFNTPKIRLLRLIGIQGLNYGTLPVVMPNINESMASLSLIGFCDKDQDEGGMENNEDKENNADPVNQSIESEVSCKSDESEVSSESDESEVEFGLSQDLF